jgi:hypothetical protein
MTADELTYLRKWRKEQDQLDRLAREENELLKRLLASIKAQLEKGRFILCHASSSIPKST